MEKENKDDAGICQKLQFCAEVRKAENEDGKRKWIWYKKNILKKFSTEIENTYACLTWEATEKAPAEQKTDRQAVQRAAHHPAKRRNSNWLFWKNYGFYTHLDRAETTISSFAGKHIIFWRQTYNLLKASVSSFDSVRERALTRGSSRVVRIASSEQFVSLFSVFLRPRLVLWVECYFDEVAFRGSL